MTTPEQRPSRSGRRPPRNFDQLAWVGEGNRYMLPRTFRADAVIGVGGPTVQIEVELDPSAKRAIARRVSVEAAAGVGSATLRKVPVRDFVATGCLSNLWRASVQSDGQVKLTPLNPADSDEIRQIVQGLVGYNPNVGEVTS